MRILKVFVQGYEVPRRCIDSPTLLRSEVRCLLCYTRNSIGCSVFSDQMKCHKTDRCAVLIFVGIIIESKNYGHFQATKKIFHRTLNRETLLGNGNIALYFDGGHHLHIVSGNVDRRSK